MKKMSTSERLKQLQEKLSIYANSDEVKNEMSRFFEGKPKYIVFLSASSGDERATVVHGVANSFEASWQNARNQLRKLLFKKKFHPIWLKADLVTTIDTYSYEEFLSHVGRIKRNYFREGIAFDRMFNTAFLEQEVNANVFVQGVQDNEPTLSLKNINFYRKRYQGFHRPLKEEHIQTVHTFQTKAFFSDEEGIHEIENGSLSNGCRVVEKIDAPFVKEIIDRSSSFLAGEVLESGQFRYGYFPAFDREINTYNILRHSSTTYSMVEAYEITKRPELKDAIQRALQFLIDDAIKLKEVEGKERAFVIEKSLGDEIKLGANAAAILAFAKYTTVIGDKQYIPIMEQLAAGIEYFQREDGSFVHVLNYPDLSIKDEYRTIYYDGEAAFGLMRLYDIVHDDQWLHLVEKAFEHFIEAEHWKHGDHWLSYCSNELFTYRPERKYAAFNLKNASRMLDFSLTRETAFPTLLELMMASHNMIVKMKEEQLHLDLLNTFNEDKLQKVIAHRVRHQLNSYFWPEMAMYFKVPNHIVHSFYIRHHSYRVRIDDVEHNISGYCNYYHNVLMVPRQEEYASKEQTIYKQYQPKERLVGMVRSKEQPTKEANIAAYVAQQHGEEFVYFNEDGINREEQTVRGYLFKEMNEWQPVEVPYPSYVDNLTTTQFLENVIHLQKEKINWSQWTEQLSKQSLLKHFVMPLHAVTTKEEIINYLDVYPAITIQQNNEVVQSVVSYEDMYLVAFDHQFVQVSKEHIKEALVDIEQDTYVQQYVQMATDIGIPYKFKYLLQHFEGKWQIAHSYAQLNHHFGFDFEMTNETSAITVETMLQRQYAEQEAEVMTAMKGLLETLINTLNKEQQVKIPLIEVVLSVDINGRPWVENLRLPSKYFREELDVQLRLKEEGFGDKNDR